jgi:hypothetical protein
MAHRAGFAPGRHAGSAQLPPLMQMFLRRLKKVSAEPERHAAAIV